MSNLTAFFQGLKPIPITTCDVWADSNYFLTSDTSAEPGRFDTSRVPWVREPMQALSPNSPVNEVIVMKGIQLAFTTMGMAIMGAYADLNPCPVMYVMPSLDIAKEFSGTRIDSMIDNSPALKKIFADKKERDSGNTQFLKKFRGGFWKFCGSNSAASLRSRAARLLILDETDAYPTNVEGEGSPMALAEKRQVTFGAKKKTLKISSPKMEHTSVIEPAYLETDQRKFFVPCPHCAVFQELKFDQLRVQGDGVNKAVLYQCGESECGELIEERYKTKMLASGEWRMTCPEKYSPLKRGYHINSLYSPLGWLSWLDIVNEYEAALKDDNLMITFVNTVLGETWKARGEVPAWENLYNRAENYPLNKPTNDVYFVSVGIDVQGDRLEAHVTGWGKEKRMWSLDYRVFVGSPNENKTWDPVRGLVNERWERPDGILLPMKIMCIDTGGHWLQKVLEFTRGFDLTRVVPIKGSSNFNALPVSMPHSVDTTKAGKKIGTTKMWQIGVSGLKSEIYGNLKLEKIEGVAPPGFMTFPKYPEKFFRGLTAEQLVVSTDKGGFKKYEWIKKFQENEPLDTTVYARAGAAIVGIDRMRPEQFDEMLGDYGRTERNAMKIARPKSKFWD